MVDTERAANVQTLRALFSQQPVMGMHPSSKVSRTPENLGNSTDQDCAISESPNCDANINVTSQIVSSPTSVKPPIKPKPTIVQQSPSCNGQSAVKTMVAALDQEKSGSKSSSNSSICDSLGRSSENLKLDRPRNSGSNESIGTNVKLVKKETIVMGENDDMEVSLVNCVVTLSDCGDEQSSSAESAKTQMRKKNLPPVDKLGPAPLKPSLPINVEEKYRTIRMSKSPQPPPLPRRNTIDDIPPPERPPSVHLPLRPTRPPPSASMMRTPPSRPPPAPPVSRPKSTDVEELYGDTADVNQLERSNSLIPEYSEEDELGKKNGSPPLEIPSPPSYPPPARPKLPPPPPPPASNKMPPSNHRHDEIQNGSPNSSDQEIYEAIPADEMQGPIYSNTKEQEKQQREQQKQARREQKERDKRERENEKEKKKFGLTGDEVPIYVGCVKNDSRGGRNDLNVHKGEIVLVLRIENNPSGKWLAKNEKGKRGYVELTNIEVDADSVKSVMKSRISQSSIEDIYSDVKAEELEEEEESVYESTF